MTALLPAAQRAFVTAVSAGPATALRELSGFTPDRLFEMIMAHYPASDGPVYDDPDFRATLRTALADGFSQGPAGYARDTVLATTPWPEALFAPGVDIQLLFGSDDTVHSPDLGATLALRLPGARRTVVDGVGGALLWARADLVFSRLLA